MKTRYVVLSAIIAALYVVLTVGLAPLSYGPIQFRVSEILKIFVLVNPFLAVGIGIGTLFAILFSPNVGPLELIWMPLTDMLGGLAAWAIYRFLLRKRFAFIPMLIYSLTTGAAVGLMLFLLGAGDFWLLAIPIFISEAIILITGLPIIFGIIKILNSRGIDLQLDSSNH